MSVSEPASHGTDVLIAVVPSALFVTIFREKVWSRERTMYVRQGADLSWRSSGSRLLYPGRIGIEVAAAAY